MMKWYYEWKLSKVRAEIAELEKQTRVRLQDDYTVHSRLRVLNRLAASLQLRLAKYSSPTGRLETEEAH
jgi:head-tail adaptor